MSRRRQRTLSRATAHSTAAGLEMADSTPMARGHRRSTNAAGRGRARISLRCLVVGDPFNLRRDRRHRRLDTSAPEVALGGGADTGARDPRGHGHSHLGEGCRVVAEAAWHRCLQPRQLFRRGRGRSSYFGRAGLSGQKRAFQPTFRWTTAAQIGCTVHRTLRVNWRHCRYCGCNRSCSRRSAPSRLPRRNLYAAARTAGVFHWSLQDRQRSRSPSLSGGLARYAIDTAKRSMASALGSSRCSNPRSHHS